MGVIRVRVRAKPGASRTQVGGTHGPDADLIVAVASRAVDGAASEAVVRAVADALGLKRRDVTIASGHRSRTKVLSLDVADGDVPQVAARLAELRNAAPR